MRVASLLAAAETYGFVPREIAALLSKAEALPLPAGHRYRWTRVHV